MRKLVLLGLLLCGSLGFSQTMDFYYEMETNGFVSGYNLKTDGNLSLWREVKKIAPTENTTVGFIASENYLMKKVYKNYQKNEMLSTIKILGHKYTIKEPLNVIKWEITEDQETVLGKKCQIAKTTYKGRTYYASFTTEIPIIDGPWKFSGLPGMILKVISNDHGEYYKLECLEIKKIPQENLKLVYDAFQTANTFMSWSDYLEAVNKAVDKHIRYAKSRSESDTYASKIRLTNYLEIFNKQIQLEGVRIN